MERGFSNLPHEIIFDILSRLPVKSLCRFKSVSKSWLALITGTHFIKSHLNHHSTDDDSMTHKLILTSRYSRSIYLIDYPEPEHAVPELEIPGMQFAGTRGSCNGVLLLDKGAELCLWNPSIRRYQKFSRPKCPFNTPYTPYCVMSGLGYDAISDDFKVVAVVRLLCDAFTVVDVFSSKLSSWKSIGDFGYRSRPDAPDAPGSVLNGAPHWLLPGNTDMYCRIVCFDVTEEKFKEVPKPIYEVEEDCFYLGVLGGWLCVVDHSQVSHSDVWVMKEYGVKESWTKLFVVPIVAEEEFSFYYFEPLCFTKGGEVIMKLDSEKLVIYNLKQNRYKRIGVPQGCKQFDVTLYVESLVSPHGFNDTRRYC